MESVSWCLNPTTSFVGQYFFAKALSPLSVVLIVLVHVVASSASASVLVVASFDGIFVFSGDGFSVDPKSPSWLAQKSLFDLSQHFLRLI